VFITDYAPEESKRMWLGFYLLMVIVGNAAGFGYSAIISGAFGWHWAFWIEGLLMLPLAAFCFTIPYELKGNSTQSGAEHPHWWLEVRTILNSKIFILVTLGYAAFFATTSSLTTYGTTFIEGFQMFSSESAASLSFSGVVAVSGLFGTASGAYLSARAKERFPMNREKKRTVDLILMVVTLLAATCILAIAPFQSNRWLLLGFIALGCTFLFMGSTSVTMTILTSVPKNMKASATALMTLGIHAFGDVPFTPLLGLLKTTLAPKCDFIDEKLNPACPEDIAGLRYTFLACVCWLFWAVLLWGVAALIDIFRPAGTFMNYEGGTFDSFMAADGVEPIMDPPPRGSSLALLRNNEGSRRSSSGSDSDPGSKV